MICLTLLLRRNRGQSVFAPNMAAEVNAEKWYWAIRQATLSYRRTNQYTHRLIEVSRFDYIDLIFVKHGHIRQKIIHETLCENMQAMLITKRGRDIESMYLPFNSFVFFLFCEISFVFDNLIFLKSEQKRCFTDNYFETFSIVSNKKGNYCK